MAVLATLLRTTGSPIAFATIDEEGIQHYAPAPPPGDKISRMCHLRDQCAAGKPENGAPDEILEERRQFDGSTTPRQCLFSYLKHLVQWVRVFDASDPHDKVFSVLGMVKRYLPPCVEMPIKADYSMSVEELYTTTTFKLIQELPLLSVLSMVEDRSWREIHTLPSWVPDFSQTRPLTQLAEVFCERHIDCTRYISGNNRPRRISGSTLHIHGAFIDIIQETTPPEGTEHTSYDFKHPTILIWLNSILKLLAKQVRQPYFTGEDYMDVFWKTHMAYIECPNEKYKKLKYNDPEQISESFRCWLVHLLTIPFDPMSKSMKYIEVGISLMDCVKKIVTHTQGKSRRWFRLQDDIARYARAQWAKLVGEENGTVRFGDWPDDPAEAAKMMEKLSREDEKQEIEPGQEWSMGTEENRGEESRESKDLALAKALSENDDFAIAKALQDEEGEGEEDEEGENGRFVLMDNMPEADVAEAEWAELSRKKDEYSQQTWATINRLMFVSKHQGYIGLCPQSSRAGDQIWYIEDAAVLFVLRPRARDDGPAHGGGMRGDVYGVGDETFELVGEAFVHGLMGGELLGEENRYRGKVRPVALR
jgi:hypothetical protein